MATSSSLSPTPTTYSVYSIHAVLAVCENKDFAESFHDALCNSDFSYGNNGDTLICASDFEEFFMDFCENNAEEYPNGSINKRNIKELIARMRFENNTVPTFVGLGC